MSFEKHQMKILSGSLLANAVFIGYLASLWMGPSFHHPHDNMRAPAPMMPGYERDHRPFPQKDGEGRDSDAKAFRPQFPASPMERMKMAADHVDEKYRKDLIALIGKQEETARASMDAMRCRMDEMFDSSSAKTFDKDALLAKEKVVSQEDAKIKEALLNTMIDIASMLPDEQRVSFFKEIVPAGAFAGKPEHEGPQGRGSRNEPNGPEMGGKMPGGEIPCDRPFDKGERPEFPPAPMPPEKR